MVIGAGGVGGGDEAGDGVGAGVDVVDANVVDAKEWHGGGVAAGGGEGSDFDDKEEVARFSSCVWFGAKSVGRAPVLGALGPGCGEASRAAPWTRQCACGASV